MKTWIFLFVTTLILLTAIDGLWITIVMSKVYKRSVPHLLASSITMWPAILFYIIYALGICMLVIKHAQFYQDPLIASLILGMVLGLLVYGGYDLTNLATLRGWPVGLTILDITWGSFMTAAVAFFSLYLKNKLL